MFRDLFTDMAITGGQNFHFPVTDCLSCPGQDIIYIIAVVSCLCLPMEPPARIRQGMIFPFSSMNILAVISPEPRFIPGAVRFGISLKLISTVVPPCFDTLKLMGSYLLGTWKFAP